jgi:DNA-binding FadR family transcriptional regulator
LADGSTASTPPGGPDLAGQGGAAGTGKGGAAGSGRGGVAGTGKGARSRPRVAGALRERTLASRLARAIEQEIMRRGWPVGEGLGSEAQLMERYQVGRSVFREAVRILESRWVARPRPGPGGGLVVTAPDHEAVRDITRVYLDFVGSKPEHVVAAWSTMEAAAVRDLARSIDAAGVKRLRDVLDQDRQPGRRPSAGHAAFHLEIVRLAGNPVVELFIRVLADLVHPPADHTDPCVGCRQCPAHGEIVDAIADGEVTLAQHRVRACIQRHAEVAAACPAAANPGADR